jgi:hypothetical protein
MKRNVNNMIQDAEYYKIKILEAKIDYSNLMIRTMLAMESYSKTTKKIFYETYQHEDLVKYDDGTDEHAYEILQGYIEELRKAEKEVLEAKEEYEKFKKEYFGD